MDKLLSMMALQPDAASRQKKGTYMGIDIQGWVEIDKPYVWEGKPQPNWYGVIQVQSLVERSYPMFGSLFGYGDGYGFIPLAADRGVPQDALDAYWQWHEIFGGAHTTWVLLTELAAVDWDEEGEDYIDETTMQVVDGPGIGRRRQRRGDYLSSGVGAGSRSDEAAGAGLWI
jgi:hypothetical protein